MGFPSYRSGTGNSHKLSIRKESVKNKKDECNVDISCGIHSETHT